MDLKLSILVGMERGHYRMIKDGYLTCLFPSYTFNFSMSIYFFTVGLFHLHLLALLIYLDLYSRQCFLPRSTWILLNSFIQLPSSLCLLLPTTSTYHCLNNWLDLLELTFLPRPLKVLWEMPSVMTDECGEGERQNTLSTAALEGHAACL